MQMEEIGPGAPVPSGSFGSANCFGTKFIGFKTSMTSGRKEPHNNAANRRLVILRAIIIGTQTIFEKTLKKENIPSS